LLAVIGCGAAPRRPALPPQPPTAARPVPYGVVSSDQRSIYVINAQHRVDAVDVATGATRWTSTWIGVPLQALDDLVLVLVERRVLAVRADDGLTTWQSELLPAPPIWSQLRRVALEQQRLTADLYQVHPGGGAGPCSERMTARLVLDLVSGRATATAAAGETRWDHCQYWQPATLPAGLTLTIEETPGGTRSEGGLEWMALQLVAKDAAGAVRWTHAVPPADITPYP